MPKSVGSRAAGLSLAVLLIVLLAAVFLSVFRRHLGGFWEVRYVELLSFAGTMLIGVWGTYFISKRLAAVSGRQQMVMSRLTEIDAALLRLQVAWSEHCDAPSPARFRSVVGSFRSLGVLVSSVADLDGVEAEELRGRWIALRKAATMSIGENVGLGRDSVERTKAESCFDDCRMSSLSVASSLYKPY
jgi:hypothetical protein